MGHPTEWVVTQFDHDLHFLTAASGEAGSIEELSTSASIKRNEFLPNDRG